MDNKKWYSRYATVFWWTLTILPLLIALIYFIGYHLTFNSGINTAQELSSYHYDIKGNFLEYFGVVVDGDFICFRQLCIPFLTTMFEDLFSSLNIDNNTHFGVLFGWMTSVQIYHLFFDFAIFIPHFAHRLMTKWGDIE